MSWAQAKASHDNPNWSADRPQSWACLFLFLYSFPKLPITSFMPIRILPFQLKTYLLCKSFPNALDRNRSFLFLNFHRPVSLSNTDCTFCYAFFASPQETLSSQRTGTTCYRAPCFSWYLECLTHIRWLIERKKEHVAKSLNRNQGAL